MQPETIETKLQRSDALRSLTMEKEVVRRLRRLGWECVHSCYFKDLETTKLREIDVVAQRDWTKKLQGGSQVARVNLVIECKSVRGYHLLSIE